MADLDEISHMLGRVDANIVHIMSWQRDHEERDQERYDQLTTRIDASNHVKTRVADVEVVVRAHQPVIELVRRVRWAAVVFGTIVISLAGVAGSVGSFAKDWLFQ